MQRFFLCFLVCFNSIAWGDRPSNCDPAALEALAYKIGVHPNLLRDLGAEPSFQKKTFQKVLTIHFTENEQAQATLEERNDRNLHSAWNERAEAFAPHGDVGAWREIADTISPKVAERFLADETVPLLFRLGIADYLEFKKSHGIEVDHPIYRFYLHAVGKLWLAQRQQRGEND